MNALKIFLLQVLIIITCGYVAQRYNQQEVDDSSYIQLRKPKQIIEKQNNAPASLETDEMNQNNLVYNERTVPVVEVKDSHSNTVDYVEEIDSYGFPKRKRKISDWPVAEGQQK